MALATAFRGSSGPSMERHLVLRIVQSLVAAALIATALASLSRSATRRRHLARGTPERAILAYPRWTAWLGLGCGALFSAFAWFAWNAPPRRGGPMVALAFVAFALLGAVLVVAVLADVFVVDEDLSLIHI